MKKSAEALSSVLDSLVGSKHYAHMQHMRNSTLTNPNLTPASHVTAHGIPATSPRHQSATANSHIGSALIAALKHACDAPVPDSQHNPPDTPVPDSHHSSAARLPRHEHFAAAYAADWACLMWLLQTAPEEVIIALRAKWQEHQAQEFAMWVRPASELNPVRNKAAAKVQQGQC